MVGSRNEEHGRGFGDEHYAEWVKVSWGESEEDRHVYAFLIFLDVESNNEKWGNLLLVLFSLNGQDS